MSVLIKGMKMPENCNECDFCHWSNLHQTGMCDRCDDEPVCADFGTDYKRTRARFCPLAEVKTPHGRLIDADRFAEFIKDAIKRQKYEILNIDEILTVEDVLNSVVAELEGTSVEGFKNAPTVIEAEEDYED